MRRLGWRSSEKRAYREWDRIISSTNEKLRKINQAPVGAVHPNDRLKGNRDAK
jgi:hypothetical protein